jgi:hypothetical protein
VLAVSTSSVPRDHWDLAVIALKRIHTAHPDVRIVLCGDGADRDMAGTPHEWLPTISSAGFEGLLSERPICLALYPWVRPAWIYELMAAICPVIASSAACNRPLPHTETTEGFISVSTNSVAIEEAIDSLLVDRIRLSALTHRAETHLRHTVNVREAARTLLEILAVSFTGTVGHPVDAERETARALISIAS